MLFHYRAYKDRKIQTGKIEANRAEDVVAYLKGNRFFPIAVDPIKSNGGSLFAFFFDRVSFNDVVNLTRQLAIMLNAGLTLVDSFDILKKQTTKLSLLKVIEDINKDIRGGQTFSSALKKYPQLFPNLYIALVKSGEASGKLSEILLKLSENLEKQREFQGKIKGALIYPVIVIIAMVTVMFIMVTFVVPRLLGLYKDFNIALPITTQILILISSFSARFWPFIIIGIVFGSSLLGRYLQTKSGRYNRDRLLFKLPVINNIVKISSLVDATRTLSILISSGVSILEALTIVIETSSNVIYQMALENIYKQVEKGVSLGTAMANEQIFPAILVQMTTVGEQTGHLDDTLMRISRYFEMESELAVKAMTTLIEPLILVVLGLGVGFLVMSVITPIYNLTSSFN
ncbi:type II secretion system F family protein [Patescibacteria group bacterium]|nr:type II secretion system F family protein [Patescibacteria group bacterium]MCL5091857.1 type II secretion system F family protein [Patescibacteria group bacterium]